MGPTRKSGPGSEGRMPPSTSKTAAAAASTSAGRTSASTSAAAAAYRGERGASTHHATSNGKARQIESNKNRRVEDDPFVDPPSGVQDDVVNRVGILELQSGALSVGDDGRAVVWLDIDNTLYSKKADIARHMTARIRAYIIGLGMGEEEADRLHRKYYKEYGLAIRGLVMHHKIDALDYDAKCDATLPLEEALQPDEEVKAMLASLDRSKCRVWALTNAYKTHALRVLDLLGLKEQIEGVIFCDYGQERFACKPEREFYDAALKIVGLKDASRCYFVDDSALNIRAARKLGWHNCVLFDEDVGEKKQVDSGKSNHTNGVTAPSKTFDPSVLLPNGNAHGRHQSSPFDVATIQSQFRSLSQPQRIELLQIILDACLPGDLVSMRKTLEKQLRLARDMISNLSDEICLRIFERLEVKEVGGERDIHVGSLSRMNLCGLFPTPNDQLLNCQMVSKRWNMIAANPLLWKSHALSLTEDDPVGVTAPSDPSGWAPLVRGLYFRERNWAKGLCQNVTLMHGHTGFVTAMKLKGRRTLVTGSYDETIRVWDLYTGACKKVLTAKAISCLDFLSEEGILAAGLYDSGRVMIWDMKSWNLLQTLSGHNRGIRNVAINDTYLVSVGQDKAIVVWDWRKGVKLVRFGQQSNVSLGVSIVDQDKIVAVTVDGIIRTFCIRTKEMIGQFEVSKLSSSTTLASQRLSEMKSGNNIMMQWFAANRNTVTLASQNLVIHLKWQEHIVKVVPKEESRGEVRPRRSDSISSVKSTSSSNMTTRSSQSRRLSLTPAKGSAGTDEGNGQQASSTPAPAPRTSTSTTNRLMTPSRFQTPPRQSPKDSPASSSPVPWPRPPQSNSNANSKNRHSLSLSTSSTSIASPSPSPAKRLHTAALSPVSGSSEPLLGPPASAQSPISFPTPTRIAPNLGAPPVVVDVLTTPDAAVGCIDPAKKRIVLASRFSTRAGADRKIYTSTLGEGGRATTEDGREGETAAPSSSIMKTEEKKGGGKVVPIAGAWQAQEEELATPARNPMSLVMDHENCVVGTSEGLVYRMGFVGSDYKGGKEEEGGGEDKKEKSNDHHVAQGNGADDFTVITNLLQLRTTWRHLFL